MLFLPKTPRSWFMFFIALAVLAVCALIAAAALRSDPEQRAQQGGPGSKQPKGPAPSRVLAERTLNRPPALSGQGQEAKRSVEVFINWAGKATVKEREDGRKVIQAARDNRDVAAALCEQAFAAQKRDNSRALLILSIIGEMRSPYGEECLRRFVNQPLPTKGTIVEGQIIEQVALATLQAKAIDGLAYIKTQTGDAEVLKAVAKHPSIIVRAEAITAYLWNHQDSSEARATLRKYVRKGEEIYMDRVRREEKDTANTFNPKLERYLRQHPEVMPPAPKHGGPKGPGRDVGKKRTAQPPRF